MIELLGRLPTTSSPARRSSAASRTSTPTPTTCSPRTSGSSRPPAMPRSSRGARAAALEKVTYLSSSMVFESTDRWPSKEGDERLVPPPLSSYGFQKLAVEYFARAAWDQYQVPYTILRPFNCVGIGESRALGDVEIDSGNVKLAMSHVVPDLVQKILEGQDPLHLLGDGEQVRHYTYGGDLARGHRDEPRSPRRAQQRLQHLDGGRAHRHRARRDHLAQDQGPRRAVARRPRPGFRARRAAPRPRCHQGEARCSGSRRRPPSRTCSTR